MIPDLDYVRICSTMKASRHHFVTTSAWMRFINFIIIQLDPLPLVGMVAVEFSYPFAKLSFTTQKV